MTKTAPTDTEMVPIPINEFVSGSIIPVDLFIRLGKDHFVLMAKAGTQTQIEQLTSYQNKQVDYLHVRKEEYHNYVNQNITIAGIVLTNAQVQNAQKATFLHKATNAVMTEIEDLGLNLESYEHARLVTQSTVQLVEAKIDLADLLKSLTEVSEGLVNHASAVSILAVMIGKALDWQNRAVLEKLALGGLLHDIGKKELPESVISKPRAKMTYDEVILYESHPFRGMQLLESLKSVPDDIIAIVNEHHENAIGQGFPRRLRDLRINPLARVVALANVFCELTLDNNQNARKTAAEAITHMKGAMGMPFNKQAFRALAAIAEKKKAA